MKPIKFAQEIVDALPNEGCISPAFRLQCQLAGVNDAAESLVFARQMESIAQRSFTIQYPALRARDFLPSATVGSEADEYYTMRIWDSFPMAKIVGNYDTRIPTVGASAREVTVKPFPVASSWKVSVDDMRASNRAGVQLPERLAQVARQSIELAREQVAFEGVPELGTFGLSNNPNSSILTLPNGSWSTATGEQILADLNYLVTTQMVNTNELFSPDTILLSQGGYRIVATKLLSTSNSSNRTVLEVFQAQNPGIRVDKWHRLATANAAGTGQRIVIYRNDPTVLEFLSSIEYEVMPTEYHQMTWTTVVRARYYGVQVYIPTAVSYADNSGLTS